MELNNPKHYISDLIFKISKYKKTDISRYYSLIYQSLEKLDGITKKLGLDLHFLDRFLNSSLITKNLKDEEKKFINDIKFIYKESTLAIGLLINRICKTLNANQIYLNIGVLCGYSLFAGMINTRNKVIGVDNFSQISISNEEELFFLKYNILKNTSHSFFQEDYKLFLENFYNQNQKIDFYYYDAGHSYEDQRDNLLIADNILNKNSLILIDDIGRPEVTNGTLDALVKLKNYKILDEVRTVNARHPNFWNGYFLIKKL
jgi:hypothetical protein